MLTGAEIRMHEFKRGVRGYLVDDVDAFMEKIVQDFDTLYSENHLLRDKIVSLQASIDHYRNMENTMNNSILAAQHTAELLKENARKEVDLIIEKSKIRMMDLFNVYQDVIRRINMINLDMKAQLVSQMELMEKTHKRMDDLTDYFYGEDFKALMENLDRINAQVMGEHDKKGI